VSKNLSRDEVIVTEHLADLRGKVRFLTWVSGLSWVVLVLFGGLLITGFMDWMIHFDDPGLRLGLGLSLLVMATVIAWRQLIVPLMQPLTTSFLAMRIESRFPGLRGRVLSAVEFLQHRLDSRLGSPELQQAVIDRAMRDLEKIEPTDIVETRAIRRVTIAGAALCAMIGTVVLLHPVEAATSVKRLMFPFSECQWPRQYQLKLVHADMTPVERAPDDPMKIARGDTLELYVVDERGRLPERVWFEHLIGDDKTLHRDPLRQTTLRDDKGRSREAAVISWVAVNGPLQFRATGGDDDTMRFVQVDVVQPPTLKSLRVTVTPPSYSGRAAETLPLGVGHVQGLLGTIVTVQAEADKRLKSARLRVADRPAKPLPISEDRLTFSAVFPISDPGVTAYWFELTEEAGFSDPEAPRFELRGVTDAVPDVVIEQPVADIMLSADAELTVSVLAKDDLGLKDVRLSYTLNDDPVPRQIPLVSHDPMAEPLVLSTTDYLWKLGELSLEPGSRIVFRAEAIDAYDLGPDAHIGRSSPRTITIVTKEEKQKELAGRVGDLLEELQQAAALQQRARQQVEELQTQLRTAGELRSQDLDQLHRIELDQRQAASRLNRPADGVQSQAQQIQDEYQANKLEDPESHQRLSRIVEELSRLGREQFPEIEADLTRASKEADELTRETAPPQKPDSPGNDQKTPDGTSKNKPNDTDKPETAKGPAEMDAALADAQSRQRQALQTLQELQDLLSQWRDQRDVSRELNSLITEQEQLQKESANLGQQTLSQSVNDLSPQQRADLAKMATRQLKVAERVDQFRKQLQQAAESLSERDPNAAERFDDARNELSNDGTAGKLREAAQGIAENQVGTAARMQQQALDDLRDLDKQLKREPTDDIETLVKQIEEAQQEFETLKKQQMELKEDAQDLAGQPNSPQKKEQVEELRQRQTELGEKLAEAERRLERLRLRNPVEAAERAQERLDRVNNQLQDPEMAGEAAEEMQQVVDDLEQVERDLALEKRIAQERLAVEELEKIEDQLKAIANQQKGVIEETERLEAARQERGSLSRAQARTLLSLSEVERGLQADTEQMEKSLKAAEVFSLVLRRTSRSLKLAAERLEEKQTDAAVVALERDVLKKIDSLLLVLKPDERDKSTQPENQGEPPTEGEQTKPQEAGPRGEALPQLAQLKLLKALQEEFLERTLLLDNMRDKSGNLPADAAEELDILTREQAELADLTRDLVVKMLHQQPDKDEPDAGKKSPTDEAMPKKSDPDKLDLDRLDSDTKQPARKPGSKEE
jgi:hypothetical protein